VSDIVDQNGVVYAVEISERNLRELIPVCDKRSNMIPFLNAARMVERYVEDVGEVDAIYQDVSSPDQAKIIARNSIMLKNKGYAYVAIKSQSISSSRKPKEVFEEFLDQIRKDFDVVELIDINPYDKLHLFVSLRKR